jgi:hypothetical protein
VFAVAIVLFFIIANIVKIFKNKKNILYIALSGIISILVIINVFVPMVEQVLNTKYNVFQNKNDWELEDRTLMATQVFIDDYINLDEKDNAIQDKMNLSVGMLILILPILIFTCKSEKEEKKFINQLFILGVILVFAITKFFPWKLFGFVNFIQVPWRLNLVITAAGSIVGAYAFYYTMKQNR